MAIPLEIQQMLRSLQEGDLILRAGKNHGRKITVEEKEAIQKAMHNTIARIEEAKNNLSFPMQIEIEIPKFASLTKQKILKRDYSKKFSNAPLITKQGRRQLTSLNDFVENATFEVHTVRSKNKQGTKTGKYIDWKATTEDWKHEALNDCKDNKNDLYPTTADCAIDTLREDHPEFCLFGSRCLNESVEKAIEKEYKNYSKVEFDEIPDEVIEIMMKNQMLEEAVF